METHDVLIWQELINPLENARRYSKVFDALMDSTLMDRLRIERYEQTMDFSCGPASLLMAFRYHDRDVPLDQTEEVEIWRDANMVAIWGALRYGMTYASLCRGFATRLVSDADDLGFAGRAGSRHLRIDRDTLRFFFEHARISSLRLGLAEEVRTPTLDDIRSALKSGEVPIVLISTKLFENEDIPHWVVISGVGSKSIWMNNPLSSRREIYPIPDILENFGFFGERSLICIGPKHPVRKRRVRPGAYMEPPATTYIKRVELD